MLSNMSFDAMEKELKRIIIAKFVNLIIILLQIMQMIKIVIQYVRSIIILIQIISIIALMKKFVQAIIIF